MQLPIQRFAVEKAFIPFAPERTDVRLQRKPSVEEALCFVFFGRGKPSPKFFVAELVNTFVGYFLVGKTYSFRNLIDFVGKQLIFSRNLRRVFQTNRTPIGEIESD